jgi:hypothetical protein
MGSKARQFANLLGADGKIQTDQISSGAITSDLLAEGAVTDPTPSVVSDQNNTSTGFYDLPAGTTAQRPESPNTGYVRFNTTLDQLEQYTSESGWQGISAPPIITTTDVTDVNEADSSQVIVITGQNFDTIATAVLIDANSVVKTPTTSVRNSSSQITITYSGGDLITPSDAEPLSVKVTNGSGLTATLNGQINIDATPIWSTSAGTLATIDDIDTGTHATVSASDPEESTISYSVTSGALPGGLTLNSSTGVISGDPTDVDDTTQFNFSISASDGTGNSTPRAFNIIVNKYPDGTSSARAVTTTTQLLTIDAPAGVYWMTCSTYNSGNPFQVAYAPYDNRGWIEVLYSANGTVTTPWSTWHNGANAYFISHLTTSGSIAGYTGTSGSIALGSAFSATDFAVTSKSASNTISVIATGENQNSILPLTSTDVYGSGASSIISNFIGYFKGTNRGFHANEGSGGPDFIGGFEGAGVRGFEIVLGWRNGGLDADEWHIADGSTTDDGTYYPNIGYRSTSAYSAAKVGSWSNSTGSKGSQYDIDAGNVLSVWLTSD